MHEACCRLAPLGRIPSIIASTDGDTVVDAQWLAGIIAEIAAGADAVGGRILIQPQDRRMLDPVTRSLYLYDIGYWHWATRLEALLDPLEHDPYPRHHQHFGASLAVTCEAYLRAGGLPASEILEDVAFYEALLRVDARIRHSPAVRVFTSGRRHGRTRCGLSSQLQEWSQQSDPRFWLVESARFLETWFRLRVTLRRLWRSRHVGCDSCSAELHLVAEIMQMSPAALIEQVAATPTFGVLAEQLHLRRHIILQLLQETGLEDTRQAMQGLRARVHSFHSPRSALRLENTVRTHPNGTRTAARPECAAA